MQELMFPFNGSFLLKKRRKIKRELLASENQLIEKRIAILGGSTTHDIRDMLELFLLNEGICPVFYESEYAQYWQDAMFDNETLRSFSPDIIYIHTTFRNLAILPTVRDTKETVEQKLKDQYAHFYEMWERLMTVYHCPIIQNNIERPIHRLLGNKDISDWHGYSNFVARLNQNFYEYAQAHDGFYINDIDYLSSVYGLEKWSDPIYWHMYKYALSLQAIPELAFSVSNIIKAIYGKNKKALVLDLDNTLWGGVVGDDGVDGLVIGQETPMGQIYTEFQKYIKKQKDIGVLLNVCSKNDEMNAIAGLSHPDGVLKPEDFICIKANWNNKDQNILEIASELNIGADSLVFIDDNPAEREIVKAQIQGIAVPNIGCVEDYLTRIDRNGFFEVVNLSEDDLKRNDMYKANTERTKLKNTFQDYEEYLKSLDMVGTIRDFEPVYIARIAQLTNKSNQFNLTTKRYTENEIQNVFDSTDHIRLYGKLKDRFGDNGIVSVVIGRIENEALHIDLWLMSCRVLKRNMEYAMLDRLVEEVSSRNLKKLIGYYFPTAKNNMVKQFYETMGFEKLSEDVNGNTVWQLSVDAYKNKNFVIKVVK